jgi:hypothetical protein
MSWKDRRSPKILSNVLSFFMNPRKRIWSETWVCVIAQTNRKYLYYHVFLYGHDTLRFISGINEFKKSGSLVTLYTMNAETFGILNKEF